MAELLKTIKARAGNKSYDILIGNNVFRKLKDNRIYMDSDKAVFIISSRVYELHKNFIRDTLKDSDRENHIFIMNDSEKNKNYKYAEKFLNLFLKKGITRKSVVISIGGGVVGDFAGYISALYMRGVPLIHVPTTLLSMVDSSIGGKVAVNLDTGKNIAGAFHQPSFVISDVRFLSTLPEEEFINGLAEVLKHGLIGDYNTFTLLENADINTIYENEFLTELVAYSAKFKSEIVEKDEKESGIRVILNFGHTIGHAVESLMEYTISHGAAVSTGIIAIIKLCNRLEMITDSEVKRVLSIMKKFGLSNLDLKISPEDIIDHMKYDKKNSDDKINFVFINGIGNPVYDQQVNRNILLEELENMFC